MAREFKYANEARRRDAENFILKPVIRNGESRKILFNGKPISLSDMNGFSDVEIAGLNKLLGSNIGISNSTKKKQAFFASIDILNNDRFDVSRVLTNAEKLKEALEESKQEAKADYDISTVNGDTTLSKGRADEEIFPPEVVRERQTTLSTTRSVPNLTPESSPPTPLPPVAGGPDHRARLRPKESEREDVYGPNVANNILAPLFPDTGSNGLIWPYTPNITYAPTIDYQNHPLVFANQDFYSFSKIPSPAIQVIGQFTAQSPKEAKYVLACIHFLRVVTKMHFGEIEINRSSLAEPPPKLLFSVYGKFGFKDIPVYVQNFSIDFSNQINHVPVQSSIHFGQSSIDDPNAVRTTWVPANFVMTVSLQPQIHPADWNHPNISSETQYNWDKFATGELFEKSNGGWL